MYYNSEGRSIDSCSYMLYIGSADTSSEVTAFDRECFFHCHHLETSNKEPILHFSGIYSRLLHFNSSTQKSYYVYCMCAYTNVGANMHMHL